VSSFRSFSFLFLKGKKRDFLFGLLLPTGREGKNNGRIGASVAFEIFPTVSRVGALPERKSGAEPTNGKKG
jgi:hypothetical protein